MAMMLVVRPLLTGRDRDDQGRSPDHPALFGVRFPGDSGCPSFAFAAAFGRLLPPNYSRYGLGNLPNETCRQNQTVSRSVVGCFSAMPSRVGAATDSAAQCAPNARWRERPARH